VGQDPSVDPGELLGLLRSECGLDLAALTPTRAGESGAAFWATDRSGTDSLPKIMPGPGPAALGYLRALDATLGRLRDRGYPAPRFHAVGQAAGFAFSIQERIAGTTLDSAAGQADGGQIARLLPELIRLNDAQAGLGIDAGLGNGAGGRSAWPGLIRATLTGGGDGYCVHATLAARPETRDLLEVLRRIRETCWTAIPAANDFVHYDFGPANLLSDGTTIAGVIDINPPVLAGDRAFDLATLLFYLYEHDEVRTRLSARLLALAGQRAARAYLAHLVLRQVDWSLRFYPAAAATRRFLRLASRVVADISDGQS
jgi:Phosphotransferase enzyme family